MRDARDVGTLDLLGAEGIHDQLPALAEGLAEKRARWPRQLAELTDYLEDEARRFGLPLDQARRLACRQVARAARDIGGSQIYLPKGDALERVLRDMQIWSEHDGTPDRVETLSQRYNLTAVHIYRILAEQRALHHKAVQMALALEG